MFPYTHENHFRFGYWRTDLPDVQWFRHPAGTEDMDFVFGFNTCSYKPESFREECNRAARLITDSTEEIPNIMLSGGMESEIVVRSFMDQHLPFKVSILQFKDNLNLHDIAHAIVFCEANDIAYDIFKLDVKDFLDWQVYDYACRTYCCSPQIPVTMWLADQIDGLPILGSGEPYVFKQVPDDYVPGDSPYEPSLWFFQEKERIQSWYRHFMNQHRPAIPGFFQYTPELMYMFLVDPTVRHLVANRREGKLSTVTSKNEAYRRWYPEMTMRKKYTGFEKIPEWDETVRESLMDSYGQYNRTGEIEYHETVRRLSLGFQTDHISSHPV